MKKIVVVSIACLLAVASADCTEPPLQWTIKRECWFSEKFLTRERVEAIIKEFSSRLTDDQNKNMKAIEWCEGELVKAIKEYAHEKEQNSKKWLEQRQGYYDKAIQSNNLIQGSSTLQGIRELKEEELTEEVRKVIKLAVAAMEGNTEMLTGPYSSQEELYKRAQDAIEDIALELKPHLRGNGKEKEECEKRIVETIKRYSEAEVGQVKEYQEDREIEYENDVRFYGQIQRCSTLQEIGGLRVDSWGRQDILELVNCAINLEYRTYLDRLDKGFAERNRKAAAGDYAGFGMSAWDTYLPSRLDGLGERSKSDRNCWLTRNIQTLPDVEYEMDEHYKTNKRKGGRWKLHISAWPSSATRIMSVIYDRVKEIPYKVFSLNQDFCGFNDRTLGWSSGWEWGNYLPQYGKWMAIYPKNDEDSVKLARDLDKLLKENESYIGGPGAYVQLYGDAMVGESGGVFMRDEGMEPKVKDRVKGYRYGPVDKLSPKTNPFEGKMRVTYRGQPFNQKEHIEKDISAKNEDECIALRHKNRNDAGYVKMREDLGWLPRKPTEGGSGAD